MKEFFNLLLQQTDQPVFMYALLHLLQKSFAWRWCTVAHDKSNLTVLVIASLATLLINKKMINQFSHPKYITSESDLRNILVKCSICYRLTLKGELIVPLQALHNLMLPKPNQKNYFLVVHIPQKKQVGHWLCMAVFGSQKKVVIIDPANQYSSSAITVNAIHQFCRNNHLKEINFSTQCQSRTSYCCGQICIFFCKKMHNSTLLQLLELRKTIKSNSIHFNEHHMVHTVQQHFKVLF